MNLGRSLNPSAAMSGQNSPQSKAFQNSFDKIVQEQQKAALAAAKAASANPSNSSATTGGAAAAAAAANVSNSNETSPGAGAPPAPGGAAPSPPTTSDIELKMMTTFKKFCKLVESGTKEALHTKSKTGMLHSASSSSDSLLAVPGTSGAGGTSPRANLRPDASPSLINHRNVRRTSSGRVRAVGRTATCYMAREGAHKLRITIEARLRADAHDPNPGTSSINVAGAFGANTSGDNLGGTSTGSLVIASLSLEDQAREVRDAISTMVKALPPLIPGTPIIVVFNAILEHEPEDEGNDIQRAFSWRTQVATPDGKERLEEKQKELEEAFKAQGVSLATTKVQQEKPSGFGFFFGKEKGKSAASLVS
ncbi:hypothetical protein HK101_002741 [Irineochytrium annulatum]|nr:hypothetical protein HK101_002741 [Irineochytrium annulatum]